RDGFQLPARAYRKNLSSRGPVNQGMGLSGTDLLGIIQGACCRLPQVGGGTVLHYRQCLSVSRQIQTTGRIISGVVGKSADSPVRVTDIPDLASRSGSSVANGEQQPTSVRQPNRWSQSRSRSRHVQVSRGSVGDGNDFQNRVLSIRKLPQGDRDCLSVGGPRGSRHVTRTDQRVHTGQLALSASICGGGHQIPEPFFRTSPHVGNLLAIGRKTYRRVHVPDNLSRGAAQRRNLVQ